MPLRYEKLRCHREQPKVAGDARGGFRGGKYQPLLPEFLHALVHTLHIEIQCQCDQLSVPVRAEAGAYHRHMPRDALREIPHRLQGELKKVALLDVTAPQLARRLAERSVFMGETGTPFKIQRYPARNLDDLVERLTFVAVLVVLVALQFRREQLARLVLRERVDRKHDRAELFAIDPACNKHLNRLRHLPKKRQQVVALNFLEVVRDKNAGIAVNGRVDFLSQVVEVGCGWHAQHLCRFEQEFPVTREGRLARSKGITPNPCLCRQRHDELELTRIE